MKFKKIIAILAILFTFAFASTAVEAKAFSRDSNYVYMNMDTGYNVWVSSLGYTNVRACLSKKYAGVIVASTCSYPIADSVYAFSNAAIDAIRGTATYVLMTPVLVGRQGTNPELTFEVMNDTDGYWFDAYASPKNLYVDNTANYVQIFNYNYTAGGGIRR